MKFLGHSAFSNLKMILDFINAENLVPYESGKTFFPWTSKDLKRDQKDLRDFLDQLISAPAGSIFPLPKKFRPVFRKDGFFKITFYTEDFIKKLPEGKFWSKDNVIYFEKPLIVFLIEELNNVPIGWIKKCLGCGKFFLHPYKRRKIYCDANCAARTIQRRKREVLRKNPKLYAAYLKKQREYVRKKYEGEIRAKYGQKIRIRSLKRKLASAL